MNAKVHFSRRALLTHTLPAAALGVAGALELSSARAEPTYENNADVTPVADISAGGRVTQITMVVSDVAKVARMFSDVFGPSWEFFDYHPKLRVLHGAPAADSECALKIAVGYCGGQSFRLVQPVSGSSAYAEFLRTQGEGFYGIGVGAYANHDAMLESLNKAGAATEMQLDAGDGFLTSILDTTADFGLRVEFTNFGTAVLPSALKRTGEYVPRRPSIMDMTNPKLAGGKKFTQLGIVVKDGHHGARRLAELFGIRSWRFQSLPVTYYAMFGNVLKDADLPSTTCEQCVAYLGDTQIELLVPVKEGPGGIHRRFFDRHGTGNGFQHLMLTPRTYSDHDATLKALWDRGMSKEIEYRLSLNTNGPLGHYTGMEQQMGGFVLEY